MITSFEQLPLFLTVEELAGALKIGRSTAYNLVRAEKIFSYRAGAQYRSPKESLQNLLPDDNASFR